MNRRSIVVLLAVVAVALLGAGNASAQGICVNVSGSCNSYYFGVSSTNTADLLQLDGFEYGCGLSQTRHASGVLRVKTDRLEVSFEGTNRQFDFTQSVNWSGEVARPSLAGVYNVEYVYINGGVLSAHGFAGLAFSLTGCAEPAVPTNVADKDTSKP
jgi:hypothetical protein